MKYMYKGKYKEALWDEMMGDILKAVGTDFYYCSTGPTAVDIMSDGSINLLRHRVEHR
jgi:hypothetical protein